MTLYLGTNLVSGSTVMMDKSERIGQIIQSTIPLTDAGLHLLDGDLISGSGSYSAFVTYIASLVSTYSNLFTTEADWQTTVNTYGVCGKFVYDSTNNTVRLPQITGFTEGTITPSILGNLTEAGLPNITGSLTVDQNLITDSTNDSALYTTRGSTYTHSTSSSSDGCETINFDASRSSSIYGNSTIVQPQSIKVLYYIVIATTTKTDIQVDIDEVMTDLNMKMDIQELANVHCVIETYSNGASWYRLYDDGWVEQGGITSYSVNAETITFLVPFLNTNYSINVSGTCRTNNSTDTGGRGDLPEASNYTTTSFRISQASASDRCTSWEAKGYKG